MSFPPQMYPESADPKNSTPAHLLVVDDEEMVRLILSQTLEPTYRVSLAENGERALQVLTSDSPDVILSDLLMPGIHGMELLRRAKEIDPAVGFIVITGNADLDIMEDALRYESDGLLQKPFNLREVRFSVARALRHRALVQQTQQHPPTTGESGHSPFSVNGLLFDGLRAAVRAVERRDGYHGQAERVAALASAIGLELGLDESQLQQLWIAGLLRDIGNVSIPERILRKRGPLTREEHDLVKRHPAASAAFLESQGLLPAVVVGVRHHHERWNGSGYPDGLRAEEIPLTGRILAIADCFNAMVTDRPFRAARTENAAHAELRQGVGFHFDPQVVDAFARARHAGLPQHPRMESLLRTPSVEAS